MQALQDIFGIWPTTKEMASELAAKPDTVRKWKKFRRIPQAAWRSVIDAAARRGHSITASELLDFNAPMKPRGQPAHKPRKTRSRKRLEARVS